MDKTNLLLGSGITTLLGQMAFLTGMNGLGIALSAAALPMLLPLAMIAIKQARRAGHCQVSYA